MKLTNEQLIDSFSALQILSQNQQIKAPTAYKIMKAHGKLEAALKVFEKTREALIARLAERDEAGGIVYGDDKRSSVKLKDPVEGMREHQALMESETDDLGITAVKIDDLGDALVTPAILKSLEWLVQ